MSRPSHAINSGVLKEMLQMHRLYVFILEAYRNKLLDEVEKGKRLQGIDEQQVQKYIEAIKYFLNNQVKAYDSIVGKRESGVNDRKGKEPTCKLENVSTKIDIKPHENAIKVQQNKVKSVKEEQYKFDYTSMFSFTKNLYKHESFVKMEPFAKMEPTKLEQQPQSSSQSEESAEQDEYLEKAQKQTCYFIFGLFSRQNIKRQVKKGKICLYFDDMFVKCFTNGRDAYFQRAIIELSHIEKEDAPVS